MFGLTFEKLMIIGVIAVFLIGPQKLPLYAEKLGSFVRAVRGFSDTARARVAEELGPDFDQTDWKKLDPRQYDPRQIVRRALIDDPSSDSEPSTEPPRGSDQVAPSLSPSPSRPVAAGGWQEALLARVGSSHQS